MRKNKALLATIGLVTLICILVFKNYLRFRDAYFFYDICGDGYYCSYPVIYNLADAVANHFVPTWSFKIGMGQNIFPFTFRDPFDIIFYIFGKKNIIGLTAYVEVLKIILSAILFNSYLKLLKFSDFTCSIGAILFAFCGFITVGSAWFGFSFEAFNFALFLLAFELLFVKQKWMLFPVAVFFISISMPFNLYMYGLFMALYAILRHLQSGSFNLVKLSLLLAKMAGLGMLGILISGPFILENILVILNSPRGAGGSSLVHQYSSLPVFALSDDLQLGTSIMRFFSNDILGSGSNFKGWDTILGAPLFYCGLPCLLLFPQIFGSLSKRVRISFLIFISLWCMPIIFPFFRRAFWLFTGDYYRAYSFFVSFVLLFYSVIALEYIFKNRKVNVVLLISTLAVLLVLLYHPFFIDPHIIDKPIRTFVTIALLLYSILLFLVNKFKTFNYFKLIFTLVVFLEMCYTVNISVNRRDAFATGFLNDKVLYNNYTYDAVKFIQRSDSSFYRIDKNFVPATDRYTGLNYSQKQGYNSTSSYNPFNQLYYIKYLQMMGAIDKNSEQESRWAIGLLNNPILESENNVKYFLSQEGFRPVWQEMWDTLKMIGNVRIYKNKCVLPFGYTYDHIINETNFNIISSRQRQFMSLRACMVTDKDMLKVTGLKEYKIADTLTGLLNFDTFSHYFNNIQTDTLAVSKFDDNYLSGKINATNDEILYLSIPYDDGWHLYVDGIKQEKMLIDNGMTGTLLKKGFHKVEMSFELPYWQIGLLMSFSGILIVVGLFYYQRRKGN